MSIQKIGNNPWTQAMESLTKIKQAIPDPPRPNIREQELDIKVTFSEAAIRAAQDGIHRKEKTIEDLVPRFLKIF